MCTNTPLAGHNWDYLDLGKFNIDEFYNEPDSNSDMQDSVRHYAKFRKAFPRSHAGWQKRIQSSDRKMIRFQDRSRELISSARMKQGGEHMGSCIGQEIQNGTLPPGARPLSVTTQR